MRMIRLSVVLLCLGFVGTMGAVRARADVAHQTTKLTFRAPVEVPGMVLMPGTYEVRLVETASELNVVEILDSNGVHLLTMEMTIPVERPEEPAGIRQSLLKSEFPEHPRQSRIGSTPGIRTAMSSFTRTRVPT